jgi:hypothetical protein
MKEMQEPLNCVDNCTKISQPLIKKLVIYYYKVTEVFTPALTFIPGLKDI